MSDECHIRRQDDLRSGGAATTSFERKKQKAEKVVHDKTMCVGDRNDGQEMQQQAGHVHRQEVEKGTEDAFDEGATAKRMTIRISVVIRTARAFFYRHARLAPKPLIKSWRRPIFPLLRPVLPPFTSLSPILSGHMRPVRANFLATEYTSFIAAPIENHWDHLAFRTNP